METYQGKINEFVDWVSGVDSTTGYNVTGNLQPSGKAIRELVQEKLKRPFVVYEDLTAGLYRMFSSDDAKNAWLRYIAEGSEEALEKASALELFNFVRPGDYAIAFSGITSAPRYIISGGESGDSQSIIKYWVTLSKKEAGEIITDSDSFIATYTITDSNGKETVIPLTYGSEKCNKETDESAAIIFDAYQYLTEGTNTVKINLKAQNSSATNNIEFSISLIRFELSSTFDYSIPQRTNDYITVPVTIRRSVSNLTLYIDIYVLDGTDPTKVAQKVDSTETNSKELIINKTFQILNTFPANVTSQDHIKHLLRIEATMTNGNEAFRSNVLFYDFETAASTEDVHNGITNKFINILYNTPANMIEKNTNGLVILLATQYSPFVLDWAYYTDQTNNLTVNVQWALRKESGGEYTYTPISTLVATKGSIASSLIFIPTEPIVENDNIYLVSRILDIDIDEFPIIVAKSNFDIVETSGLAFKLNAYGKTNGSLDSNQWIDSISGATTNFSFETFDSTNGWDENSLVLSGVDNYAIVNYCPIPNQIQTGRGKTIEFEFKAEKVDNNNDVILRIGSNTAGHIDVTPNSASLLVGQKTVIQTNFKANEKIKLAFVFHPLTILDDPDSNLVYIINNGIVERAADADVYTYQDIQGNIKIGGAPSGIRLYNMRIYDYALSSELELDNYIYDSDSKASIISRNEILKDGAIDYYTTKGKIDTILISGNLDPILTKFNGKSECTATVERTCITDSSKDFIAKDVRVRKHGQSTLNYPVVSLKMWFNKSNAEGGNPELQLSALLTAMNLSKNRYIMKNGAIPANKYVLQANYADSSGVHNGGLERLINDTWYNALIDGEYKLRTAPQLFASNELVTHDEGLLPGETPWIEGYGNGTKGEGKQWKDFSNKEFPYKIRTAPDSFACAVFYKNDLGLIGDDSIHFLGQYVFMDDKKSDYTFGQRSIYSFGDNSDPFVMNIDNTKNGKNGKLDIAANRVWSNKDVLRIEVVLPNYALTSYMDYNVSAAYEIDGEGNVITAGGTTRCDNIKKDEKGNNVKYYWEDFFDLIYPDPDDIEEDAGVSKFDSNSKFVSTTKPFLDWLKWITGIGAMRKTNKEEANAEFRRTAAQHLDLYKLAAYYIFFLRFGLVDSVERNAQLKTYDGQHWHYEPWDMDIALGNTNQGMLVFTPPMTRDSLIPGTSNYAFSGRTTSTSNVLWDCLEEWDYWANTIVPKVSRALYASGLKYSNISSMFDDEYVNKWSETIYNNSGHYKYIENGGAQWLAWLQGARTSHRHWWLSTSMNYYDAKWSSGEFNEHRIAFFADKAPHNPESDIIIIKPTSETFFKITLNDGTASLGTISCNRTNPARFDISDKTFSAKDPSHIYGSTFVEEIDISCLAKSLNSINLSACYDSILGAPVKVVNVGVPYEIISDTVRKGYTSGTSFSLIGESGSNDALENMITLNVTGQQKLNGGLSKLISSRRSLVNLYAMGTSDTAFKNAAKGNKFENIELPACTILTKTGEDPNIKYIDTIDFTDASWKNISFWTTLLSAEYEPETEIDPETGETVVKIVDGNIVYKPNIATFTKTDLPAQLQTLKFRGSTAQNPCSGKLLLEWLSSIETKLRTENSSASNELIEQLIYNEVSSKTFEAEKINWGTEQNPADRVSISYKDLARIAHFNRGVNTNGTLKGYIRISDTLPLTTGLLSNLRLWFGESVFDLTSKEGSLVIDLNREYVQISVGGDITTVNDEIYLEEPNTAILSANKFMLGTDDTVYTWYISTSETFDAAHTPIYARIRVGDDGITRLLTQESVNGDYSVYIKVSYIENNAYHESDVVRIHITAVTYPSDYEWNVSSNIDVRKFLYTNDSGKNIFGLGKYTDPATLNLLDAYMMYIPRMEYTLLVRPTNNDFTALVKSIRYSICDITTNSNLELYNDILSDGEIDTYLSNLFTNGLLIITSNNVPQSMCKYKLRARIELGGKVIWKYLILMLYEDYSPILSASQDPLFIVMSGAYAQQYNLGQYYHDMFKSELLSILGTLNFETGNTVSSLLTNLNDNIFKYTPNIKELIMENCVNLKYLDLIEISNLINIERITLSGNANTTGSLDLSLCTNLKYINLLGTYLGIIFPTGSAILTALLGTPQQVSFVNPSLITNEGVSVLSSSELQSIVLQNVSSRASFGFNIFDILYNLTLSSCTHLELILPTAYRLEGESATPGVVEKLYNLTYENSNIGTISPLDSTSKIEGHIKVKAAHEDSVSYLVNTKSLNSGASMNLTIDVNEYYYRFLDPEVERICSEHTGDGYGCTPSRLSIASSIPNFYGNTKIRILDLSKYIVSVDVGSKMGNLPNVEAIYLGGTTKVFYAKELLPAGKTLDGVVVVGGCRNLSGNLTSDADRTIKTLVIGYMDREMPYNAFSKLKVTNFYLGNEIPPENNAVGFLYGNISNMYVPIGKISTYQNAGGGWSLAASTCTWHEYDFDNDPKGFFSYIDKNLIKSKF